MGRSRGAQIVARVVATAPADPVEAHLVATLGVVHGAGEALQAYRTQRARLDAAHDLLRELLVVTDVRTRTDLTHVARISSLLDPTGSSALPPADGSSSRTTPRDAAPG